MVITRLFKKKDDTGLYTFINEIKELNKYITIKLGKGKYLTIEEVSHVIISVKRMYKNGIELEKKLKELSNGTKKYTFHYMLLNDKMKELKSLYDKVTKFEKELSEYKKINKENGKK